MSNVKPEAPWWGAPIGLLLLVVVALTSRWVSTTQAWAAHLNLAGWIGVGAVVLTAMMMALFVLVFALFWFRDRGENAVPRSLPWRYRRWSIPTDERIFAGWSRSAWGHRVMTFARPWESLGCIARMRSGKSEGLVIPQILCWAGSLIATSTKLDIVQATLARRRRMGPVACWAPSADGRVAGMAPTSCNLIAGSKDGSIAQQRAASFLRAVAMTKGLEDGGMWEKQAGSLLTCLFHAADSSGKTLRDVLRWIEAKDLTEPIELMAKAEEDWAARLGKISKEPEKTRAGIYITAESALLTLQVGRILDRCCEDRLDIDGFLGRRGSLYVLGSLEAQAATAPLTVLLVERIVTRAMQLHQEGRLSRRLLLNLDEMPSVCPLPRLPFYLAQGAQQGISCAWYSQSWPLLVAAYGEDVAEALFEASAIKAVFGGITDTKFLERLSTLVGAHRVKDGDQPARWEPILRPHEISHLPPFQALLLLPKPYLVATKKVSAWQWLQNSTEVPPLVRVRWRDQAGDLLGRQLGRIRRRPVVTQPEPTQATEHDSDQQ